MPVLIPSELICACIVDLPATGGRQRATLLTYAVEEKIAQPIETVAVVQCGLRDALPGRALALVVARTTLAGLISAAPDAAAMPDMLLIRRPDVAPSGVTWAVWREAARAVVRVSDGTGFAISVDMLPHIWERAGRPVLISLGAALPATLPATDQSSAPPDPDPVDLTFRFPTLQSQAQRTAVLRPLIIAGLIFVVGFAVLLGLAVADTVALRRIAVVEQQRAQTALAPILPGIVIGPDIEPILSRLSPAAPQPEAGAFLPLLSAAAEALAAAGPEVSFRRLSWGAQDNRLILNLQANRLDDLQTIEQYLSARGFDVTSGAANAGDGGAEADLTISGPPG